MSHILVIDDDSAIRLSLAMLLKRRGHTVSQASGEAEALAGRTLDELAALNSRRERA